MIKNKLTKSDIVAQVAEDINISKLNTEKIFNVILKKISAAVCNGYFVNLTGFGSFQKSIRNPREGINPKTKERILIPSYATASFKVGKSFKSDVKDSGIKGLE